MRNRNATTAALPALVSVLVLGAGFASGSRMRVDQPLIPADDPRIQYVGRIDFTNHARPRFWSPGVYVRARFKGSTCSVVLGDEQLYGKSHNYVEVAVDDNAPIRVQTTGTENTIAVAQGLSSGIHTVTVCKDTESGIGFLEFVGFRCDDLAAPPPLPARRLEFIGDSITCGAGSDLTDKPCGGKSEWYDQHNAYLSYGPRTARALNAQWHITAVSGIGLMHSCCGMKVTMPQVFDAMNLRDGTGEWNAKSYQPDAVTVCLGQNDGIQDPQAFSDKYVAFIGTLRKDYTRAQIVCLTSPMADSALTAYQKTNLTRIVDRLHQSGDQNVHAFFFSRSFNGGCGGHPDLAQHQQIADELSGYLKTSLNWDLAPHMNR